MGGRSRCASTADAVSEDNISSRRMTTDLADEPVDLLPCMRLPVPHAVVDPLAGVLLQLFPMLLHEHRVGRPDLVAHLHAREHV